MLNKLVNKKSMISWEEVWLLLNSVRDEKEECKTKLTDSFRKQLTEANRIDDKFFVNN